MEEDKIVFKLCSTFLSYPENSWVHNQEMKEFITSFENRYAKKRFQDFLSFVESITFEDLCNRYVKQFDFNDQSTLYLTYGVFGDNRERGLGFVKLKMEYAKAGFFLKEEELPDYLPLILEFASVADEHIVRKLFAIHKKAMENLLQSLLKEESPYALIIEICLQSFSGLFELESNEIEKGNAS
ncbi:nitrate reductase molybdenum cofactor assembly chaperone [Bacillus sp. CGMCC 1.16607]|uniref:nitrate reductase molybdenum cofactor assembly chaperone n=1 Tax=Bacillus sp. CGMCC 1.16607 TaxID=3351842 RepID=UPI0036315B2D